MRLVRAAALAFALTSLVATSSAVAVPSSHTFVIKRGGHDSNGIALPFFNVKAPRFGKKTRVLRFEAMFTPSAIYRTANPSNQSDFCKLLGITTNQIHGTSIRLGWAAVPNEGKIQLGFYGYIKSRRVMQPLRKVSPGEWFPVEMRLGNDGTFLSVGSAPGQSWLDRASPDFKALTMTWYMQTAYFGGDEKAPHDITIYVRNVNMN